jgi:predicted transcriptional regulator
MSGNDQPVAGPAADDAAAPAEGAGRGARARRPIDVLRERQGERTPEQKDYFKRQTQVRKAMLEALKEAPRTIPELAARCGLPSEEVVWNVMAMRRYGKLIEGDLRGDYYCYRLKEV